MVELLPHQKTAVDNLSNGKILWGGVGTGKSLTVMAYYMEKEAPKHIYVITTAKKRDSLEWEGEAVKFGIGKKANATVAGCINVDSWNNISKYTDVEDAFFIFDEQRLVGTGAWAKSFQKIAKRNHWILLTATPGDTWLDYAQVFVANNLYKNITEFKREHVVYAPFSKYPKIMRYIGVRTLERYRNMLLVEMPYSKHTNRIVEEVTCEYDKDIFSIALNDRKHPYENRPIRNVGELFLVMREIVATHPSRLDSIRKILSEHPKVIIFYNFNYELDILRTLSSEIEVAEWNGKRKQKLPTSDQWVYLVQYVAGAEGWNCIETDTMAFYSLTYSYKNFEQAQGRIDRLNSPFTDLYYYVLTSDSIIDKAVRSVINNKHNFNESAWVKEHLYLDLPDY